MRRLSSFLFSDNSFLDLSSTDNMIAITQLREEVESLKKQLSQKDVQIIDRDKKVSLETRLKVVTTWKLTPLFSVYESNHTYQGPKCPVSHSNNLQCTTLVQL